MQSPEVVLHSAFLLLVEILQILLNCTAAKKTLINPVVDIFHLSFQMGYVLLRHLFGDITHIPHLMFLTKVFTEVAERRCRGVHSVLICSLAVHAPRQSFGGDLIQVPSSYEIPLCRKSPQNKECSTHRVLLLN